MKQPIIGGAANNLLNNAATEYNVLCGGAQWGSVEAERRQIASSAGTISPLRVKLDASPGIGKTWTFTVMKNGVATSLTLSISGTGTTGLGGQSVSITDGDKLSLRATSSGSPTNSNATWWCEFTGSTTGESLLLGGTSTNWVGATRWLPVAGSLGTSAIEKNAQQLIPTPGVIKKLYVEHLLAPATGSFVYTLRKNGVSTSLTCTVSGAGTTGNDLSNTVTVAAGDLVSIKCEPIGPPGNTSLVSHGMTFVADVDGESIIMGAIGNPFLTGTRYIMLVKGVFVYGTTESEHYQLTSSLVMKNLYVGVDSPPGGGNQWDSTVRKNGATTSLSTNISGANTIGSDIINTVFFTDGDDVSLEIKPTGGPDLTQHLWWGAVVISKDIYPSDRIMRVTALIHIYQPRHQPSGVYNLITQIGGLSTAMRPLGKVDQIDDDVGEGPPEDPVTGTTGEGGIVGALPPPATKPKPRTKGEIWGEAAGVLPRQRVLEVKFDKDGLPISPIRPRPFHRRTG